VPKTKVIKKLWFVNSCVKFDVLLFFFIFVKSNSVEMKKTLLSFVFFSIIFNSISQTPNGISIFLNGSTYDLSGGVYQITAPGSELFDINLNFVNNTNQTQQWIVTRKKLNVPAGWSDQLCWGHSSNTLAGGCYGVSNLNPWNSPLGEIFDVAVGEYGKLKCEINPDDVTSGTALYRYYVSSDGVNFQDSVDVQVDFVASIKPIKEEINVSIVPNPATDYIQISMTGIESASLKMLDVFGSTVLKENIGPSKKLNVSDFNSGIYFFVFEVPGRKAFTRKVIIRH
jgi:hypothetical protein